VLRHLAGALGWTQRETKERVRLSFCRVAEFQRRGVVHLHAVLRADGVDGKPPVLTAEDLARAAWSAARAVAVVHPLGVARWGNQVDVQVLDRSAGPRAQHVAGYVAKYATKSSDGGGALDAPVRSEEDLAHRSLPPHLRRMAETAWALGGDSLFEPYRLRRHAHGLGYGRPLPVEVPGLLDQLQRTQGRPGRLAGSHASGRRWRGVGRPFSRAPSACHRRRLGQ
jgi:Replication initiator protein, pSAM2